MSLGNFYSDVHTGRIAALPRRATVTSGCLTSGSPGQRIEIIVSILESGCAEAANGSDADFSQ